MCVDPDSWLGTMLSYPYPFSEELMTPEEMKIEVAATSAAIHTLLPAVSSTSDHGEAKTSCHKRPLEATTSDEQPSKKVKDTRAQELTYPYPQLVLPDVIAEAMALLDVKIARLGAEIKKLQENSRHS
jgi:hypothetical protein